MNDANSSRIESVFTGIQNSYLMIDDFRVIAGRRPVSPQVWASKKEIIA
jgi:hypothetical protein